MKTAMQQAMINANIAPKIILPLHKVWDGSKCRHTGKKWVGNKQVSTGFPDKDVVFIKSSNHSQTTVDGREVVFALNDIVEVVR